MNRIFTAVIFCILTFNLSADKRVTTIIIPHSPSVNAARELAGWEQMINNYTGDHNYGAFATLIETTLSFRPERIAQCFFGDAVLKCNNCFAVSGSRTADRTKRHWLADYFGLPTDYESYVSFRPKMTNTLADFDLFWGLDTYVHGLYVRIHAPLVYTRWDLNMCESLITTGSNAYDPGYFNPTGIPRKKLSNTFTSFITGNDAPENAGITFHKLNHAKMSCHGQRLVKLSDIQFALGYNILQSPRYHLGLQIRATAPTGNAPIGEFLFEPIIGNGHHWELGGGLSTHIILWECETTDEQAGVYFDANITHMFACEQCRSFDLCGSHNSRYMLAQRMDNDIEDNLNGLVDGEFVEPTAQIQPQFSTVANLTTVPVRVTSSVQADLAFMIGYHQGKNNWGIGYGFWGRSCECISLCGRTPFELHPWALKGDAQAYGFEDTMLNPPIALSATQRKATIKAGLNFPKSGAVTEQEVMNGKKNSAIDNAVPAYADSNETTVLNPLRTEAGGTDQINTSIQPVLLTCDDIDIKSGSTRGIAHKVFSHFNHVITLKNSHPYIGFGAEVEFGQSAIACNVVSLKEPPCVNTALSFWGFWIKGGVWF